MTAFDRYLSEMEEGSFLDAEGQNVLNITKSKSHFAEKILSQNGERFCKDSCSCEIFPLKPCQEIWVFSLTYTETANDHGSRLGDCWRWSSVTVRASTGVRIQGLGFGFVVLTPHRQTLNFYVSFEIFQTGEELTSVIPFFLKVSDCCTQSKIKRCF